MGDLLDALGLYARLVRARVRAQLQYRGSVVIETVAVVIGTFFDFVVILILFANVPRLADWSLWEVALLYGIATLSFALTDLVVGHLDLFPQLIRDGNFDLVLVRPRTTLLQIVTRDFQLRRLGKALQGLVILAYAVSQLPIAWTPDRVIVLGIAPIAGALIFGGVWVAVISVSFWTVDANEVANAFTYGGQTLAQYPMNIYDRWMRRFLAYVIPTAFVSYFPALYVLGRPDPLGLPQWLQLASPAVAVAVLVAAGTVWGFAVRHYRSAGG